MGAVGKGVLVVVARVQGCKRRGPIASTAEVWIVRMATNVSTVAAMVAISIITAVTAAAGTAGQ